MMKNEPTNRPKNHIAWLWENMKGMRVFYIIAMLGTVLYNIMQLTVPYFSGRIVDIFLSGEDAAANIATKQDLFYQLLGAMVGFTLLRTLLVYLDCMAYEHVSQRTLYKVRNFLYDKIQRQDMTFYSTYRTGDLMTRVTGDLDALRHMIAWIVRAIIESFSLFTATVLSISVKSERQSLTVSIASKAPSLSSCISLLYARGSPFMVVRSAMRCP